LQAAAFVPGGNNEIFAAAGDGQLLFWNGRELSLVRSLFKKPKPTEREVVQPGFASFSPNGQWLFIIAPTLASAAITNSASQEPCRVQIWRWDGQNRTYESAGEDLEFQQLRGSRMITFAWSPESDRVVLINTRGNEAECAFFEVKGNTFRKLLEQSKQLNNMKIVALAFAAYRTGIAAVSVDPAAPALRKISLISADDLQVMPQAIYGQDSIQLSEGFQPNDVDFGPGNNQLTLTSWSGIRILDLLSGNVISVPPPSFRDQFMRIVVGPGDFARRLVATSLYGRVEVAKGARMQEPAEPAIFGGSIGTVQFSSDGQRLLILSGGIWNLFDRMRLIDVSALYRTLELAPEKFEEEPVPPWLSDIAAAVSALDTSGDGSLMTLEDVRRKYPGSKAGDPYEAVWKRFFPDQRTAH
jgi:WD40 repeat protein